MLSTPRKNLRFFFGRPVWSNSTGTVQLHPLQYFEPKDLKELEACVAHAIDKELHVRAVGSGHSFSDAPLTEDILVGTSNLTAVTRTYPHTRKKGDFVDVQAGITVRALNKQLDTWDLSIKAMGGYDGQTVAGAILTGTHGSSLQFGAMSGMVRSLVLVTNDLAVKNAVRSYRIEPSDGFTERSSYPADQPELLQDDDVFRSVLVSFGAMGLVHSMVLEVEPTYYLEEKREMSDWPTTKALLRSGHLEKMRDAGTNVFVQINPYPTKHGGPEATLIMTHRRLTDVKEINALERLRQDLLYLLSSLNSAMRSPLLLIAGHFRFTYYWLVYRINSKPGRIGDILYSAIKGQRDRSYKNKAQKVMYQGAARLKLNAYDTECALPMDDPKVDYLEVLDELMIELRKLQADYGSHLTSPIGLRFVKASETYLTPEHKRNVCYVDCPVLKDVYGHSNIVGRVQHFFQEHNAIPHWGKRNEIFTAEDIAARYPQLAEWRKQNKRFNWNGIFSNAFTKRLVEPGGGPGNSVVEAPPKPLAQTAGGRP